METRKTGNNVKIRKNRSNVKIRTKRRKAGTKQWKRTLNGGIVSAASGKRPATSVMESYGGPHDVKVKAQVAKWHNEN